MNKKKTYNIILTLNNEINLMIAGKIVIYAKSELPFSPNKKLEC